MQYLFMLLLIILLIMLLVSLTVVNVQAETLLNETKILEAAEYNSQLLETLTADDYAALLLGRQISAIRQAMEHPQRPENLQIIKQLGFDQRYYVLVRGWLGYQLQGDMSILQTSQEKTPEKIQQRIELLQQAIRRIDLE